MGPSTSDQSPGASLVWPEEAYGSERSEFYAALLRLLGPAKWVAVVPTPAPLGAVRRAIETDCKGVLQPVELAYDGVAWLCPWSSVSEALPGLFIARRPELVFLAFDARPSIAELTAALQAGDAAPALGLLLFEDGELVEKRGGAL